MVTGEEKKTRVREFKRVRKEGGSVSVTLGTLLPKDWEMVKLVLVEAKQEEGEESVTIRFERVA